VSVRIGGWVGVDKRVTVRVEVKVCISVYAMFKFDVEVRASIGPRVLFDFWLGSKIRYEL